MASQHLTKGHRGRSKEVEGERFFVDILLRDTGSGIDPAILPRLFTKFASKSEKGGTGLDLYISKSIIEAHRGRIWADNNPGGKGATLAFRYTRALLDMIAGKQTATFSAPQLSSVICHAFSKIIQLQAKFAVAREAPCEVDIFPIRQCTRTYTKFHQDTWPIV